MSIFDKLLPVRDSEKINTEENSKIGNTTPAEDGRRQRKKAKKKGIASYLDQPLTLMAFFGILSTIVIFSVVSSKCNLF